MNIEETLDYMDIRDSVELLRDMEETLNELYVYFEAKRDSTFMELEFSEYDLFSEHIEKLKKKLEFFEEKFEKVDKISDDIILVKDSLERRLNGN